MLALLLAESAQAAAVSQSGVERYLQVDQSAKAAGWACLFFFSKGRGREGTSVQVQAHLSHCRFAPAIHVHLRLLGQMGNLPYACIPGAPPVCGLRHMELGKGPDLR